VAANAEGGYGRLHRHVQHRHLPGDDRSDPFSEKPLAMVLYGAWALIAAMKKRLPIPIFDGPEEAIKP
jgi:hypothetical protein